MTVNLIFFLNFGQFVIINAIMDVQIENAENIETPERNDGNVDVVTENSSTNCKRTFKTYIGQRTINTSLYV